VGILPTQSEGVVLFTTLIKTRYDITNTGISRHGSNDNVKRPPSTYGTPILAEL